MDAAHYLLLVCLPPSDSQASKTDTLRNELAARLAPFQFSSPEPIFRHPVYGDPARFAHIHQLRIAPETASELTWEIVAAAYNAGRPADDPDRLYVDHETAYQLGKTNLDGRCDEWEIGGRWRGHFRVKPDAVNDQRLINKRAFIEPDNPTRTSFCCDGGPLNLLDLDAMRTEALKYATRAYRKWEQIVRGTPPALGMNHYAKRYLSDPKGYPFEQAEKDYYSQPRITAIARHEASEEPPLTFLHLTPDNDIVIQLFQEGEDVIRANAVATVRVGFALLTLDGTWLWLGWPGGFESLDFPEFLHHMNTYHHDASAYLDSLSDNDRLIAVDCTG